MELLLVLIPYITVHIFQPCWTSLRWLNQYLAVDNVAQRHNTVTTPTVRQTRNPMFPSQIRAPSPNIKVKTAKISNLTTLSQSSIYIVEPFCSWILLHDITL